MKETAIFLLTVMLMVIAGCKSTPQAKDNGQIDDKQTAAMQKKVDELTSANAYLTDLMVEISGDCEKSKKDLANCQQELEKLKNAQPASDIQKQHNAATQQQDPNNKN